MIAALRRNAKVRACAIGVVALAAAVLVVFAFQQSTSAGGGTGAASGVGPVTVKGYACADGWAAPRSGQRALTVVNSGSTVADVALVGAHSLVYGEIENLAPGTTRVMRAVIPPGRYHMQCTYSENATVRSASVTVSGPAVRGAHPYLPVTYAEMASAVTAYQAKVSAGLAVVATDTDRLQRAADAGQLTEAKADWLVAHLDYERLGAAYDTFGDFNDEIDGRPNGLPLGVNDPGWTGFLRLEYALWHNQSVATTSAVANGLDDFVHGLVAAFPEQVIDGNDLSLRAHEILENTLQFQLTGESDEGSHTNLATAAANVEGTEMTLSVISPLLTARDSTLLASVTTDLHQLGALLGTYRLPDGAWTAVQSLSGSEREVLDGAIGTYLEAISPVPDILELSPEADTP